MAVPLAVVCVMLAVVELVEKSGIQNGWAHRVESLGYWCLQTMQGVCVYECTMDTVCGHLLGRVLSGGPQAKETETR